jgi:hypothetical protein
MMVPPTQLALHLLPQPSRPIVEAEATTILQTLADLLLEALGQESPTDQAGGVDEPEDHT